jgi:DNA-binding CsgD family transcriptional regulator
LREGHTLSLADAKRITADLSSPTRQAGVEAASSGGLTRRERDVLRQVAEHKTDQEVADALFLSLRTVNWHVRSILAKLDAPSRRDAILKARGAGLV